MVKKGAQFYPKIALNNKRPNSDRFFFMCGGYGTHLRGSKFNPSTRARDCEALHLGPLTFINNFEKGMMFTKCNPLYKS
jgi:hypothetical protein